MQKNKIGLEGEEIAKAYLQQNEVQILAVDYRFLRCQVDLIGLFKNQLIAYEVKTTQDPTYEEHLIYRLSARQTSVLKMLHLKLYHREKKVPKAVQS